MCREDKGICHLAQGGSFPHIDSRLPKLAPHVPDGDVTRDDIDTRMIYRQVGGPVPPDDLLGRLVVSSISHESPSPFAMSRRTIRAHAYHMKQRTRESLMKQHGSRGLAGILVKLTEQKSDRSRNRV